MVRNSKTFPLTPPLYCNVDAKCLFCSSGRTMAANMGSMRILIKGGKVVNDDFTQEADVYIENGIIQQVDHIYTVILYKYTFAF